MHRKNVWIKKWMQDPRKNFLQASYYPSAHYRKGWGYFQRKRKLNLFYSCIRLGHLSKECPGRKHSCLCCKYMDNEVLDCPRMIAKIDLMNMRHENPKEGYETETMEEPQKELENLLLQMKETLKDHRNINLSKIFKEKECIEERIGDFDIYCVLDE
jgi:hypothetical protein